MLLNLARKSYLLSRGINNKEFWGCIIVGDEEKGKAEETAEKTGEVVGKGVKKGWGIAKGVGQGLAKGVKGEEDKKEKK
jgi:hypothetical protein